MVCMIYNIKFWKEEDMIRFQITGNGFLYNMVRIIVGTLLEVGKGAIPAEEIPVILSARDRTKAGPTARAKGLTLLQIRYPDEEKTDEERAITSFTSEREAVVALSR